MATRADPVADVAAGRYAHLVGLFATDAELVTSVVDFVTPALRAGDGAAVVVATPDHQARVSAALRRSRPDPESDRCAFLDVDAVLDSFMRDGVADRDRYRSMVGGALEEYLDGGRNRRVNAELAGRLWGRGEVHAALQVEAWADELAREGSFVLLCSYARELFGDRDADGGARTVVDAHEGIVHGDLGADARGGGGHLGEMVHEEAVAQAVEHQDVRRERDALRGALEDAEQREQVRQAFTAMVVHDMRTPTTVISGLAGVLQQRLAELDPAKVKEFLATMLRNAERIERLIDDVLTVSQLESEGFAYDLAPVDLHAVAEEVAAEVRQTRGRAVEVSADPDLPPGMADADRQQRVLENLLSNAAKFSPADTPIEVRIEGDDEWLLVHVRDRGRGIASDARDRLFEPFARLDSGSADKVKGTGLGLYVTKLLVEGQGGTIDIASQPGHGTTVTYTVPAAMPTATTPATSSREQRLVRTFVELTDTLVDDFDVVDFFASLTERVVELGLAAEAGILLVDEAGALQFVAASHERTQLLELFQVQNEEGPCQDAFATAAPVSAEDFEAASERWPRFAPRAVAAGLRSVHAVPLRRRGDVLGAFNLFLREPGGLDATTAAVVQALADVATIGLLQQRELDRVHTVEGQLQRALQTRIGIEQAKGIISEQLGIEMDAAFQRLRSYARNHNRKLHDVASEVIRGALAVSELT